jgi:hypothetical protein
MSDDLSKDVQVIIERVSNIRPEERARGKKIPCFSENGGCVGVIEHFERRHHDMDRILSIYCEHGADEIRIFAINQNRKGKPTSADILEMRPVATKALFQEIGKGEACLA